ncbi:hypothetical protein PLESTB_000272900 [Pleodorina starrii]|uniref:Uncharacterized protein n=1 Tax=Pleodorina starrii TaxID=330485 RepID=A0A9W6EY58_9CHLO|nr:hypothetical protein PLESTB_000272900 [Pleodorina starrii]
MARTATKRQKLTYRDENFAANHDTELPPATLLLLLQQQPPQQPRALAGGGQPAADDSPVVGGELEADGEPADDGEPAARTEFRSAVVAPAQQQPGTGDLNEGLDEAEEFAADAEMAADAELAVTEAEVALPGHAAADDDLRAAMVKQALETLDSQPNMNFMRKRVLTRFVWKTDRAAAEAKGLPEPQPPASDLEAQLLKAEERKFQTRWFSDHKKMMESKNRLTSIVCPKSNILTLQQSGASNGGWSIQALGSLFGGLQSEEARGLQEVILAFAQRPEARLSIQQAAGVGARRAAKAAGTTRRLALPAAPARPVAGPAPLPRQPVAAAGPVGAVAGVAAGVGLQVPPPRALPQQHAVAATEGRAAAMPVAAAAQQVVHRQVARPAPHLGESATGAGAADPQVQQQRLTAAAGPVAAAGGPSGMGPPARAAAVEPYRPPPPDGLVTGPATATHQQQQLRAAAVEPYRPPPPDGLVTGPAAATHHQQQPRAAAVEPYRPPPPDGLVTGPAAATHHQQQPRAAAVEPYRPPPPDGLVTGPAAATHQQQLLRAAAVEPYRPPPPDGLVTGPAAATHQQQLLRAAAVEPGTRFERGQRAMTIKAFTWMIENQRDITWVQAITLCHGMYAAMRAVPVDKLIDAWKMAAKAAGIAHGVPSKPWGVPWGDIFRGDPGSAVAVPGVDGTRPGAQAGPSDASGHC